MTGDALSLSNVRFYDNRQPSEFDFVRIQPGRSLTFFNSRKRPPKDESLKNLEKRGDYNGSMSRATSSKVKKMLKLWMAAMQVGLDHADKTYGNKRRCPWYPRFITLTLPSEQRHTDQEIRRKFLDRFIKQLQRKAQVRYYFWKAEAQKNGNIHFHLIVDRYIHRDQVQKWWSHILQPYTEQYQMKHKTSDLPPCTQIERIRSFKKLAEYAIKYSLKDSGEEYRTIEGRIWGASKELKELKGLEVYHGEVLRSQVEFEMDQVKGYKVDYLKSEDHFLHVILSKRAWKQMTCTRLAVTNHVKKIYECLYGGRTIDYEQKIQKTVNRAHYEFNRYLYRNNPANNLALPVTL